MRSIPSDAYPSLVPPAVVIPVLILVKLEELFNAVFNNPPDGRHQVLFPSV